MKTFRLAPMSPLIRGMTLFLLSLPPLFLLGAIVGGRVLAVPALLLVALYAWIWLRCRPSRFHVDRGALRVVWPLKRREIRSAQIVHARVMDADALKREIGWGLRVGAGGLWGGFGWLWSKRRGIVQMYVSRTDRFVWIECAGARPWLLTPDEPEAFVAALPRLAERRGDAPDFVRRTLAGERGTGH